MTAELTPDPVYSLAQVDWRRTSTVFREFFRHFFVDALGLSRGEVDLAFLKQLRPDETELAQRLVRANLHLGYTHLIDGIAELGDRGAVAQLRAMLNAERDLSRKLVLGRALWRLERDPVFPALLEDMLRADSSTLKEAHLDDVLLLGDERSLDLLSRLLDDPGDVVRSITLSRLNGLEFRQHFLVAADDLPHDAAYYKARRRDPAFVAMLLRHLQSPSQAWPVV